MSEVLFHEVGPRDGLQVEATTVPTDVKELWVQAAIDAGMDIVQVGSFVHPEKVPQMADTDELFRRFQGGPPRKALLSGLVLNEKGLERGLRCGVDLFCMGVSASETHSRKNTGMSVEEATRRVVATAKLAASEGKRVQVSVQSAFGCGFEGPVPADRVLKIAGAYLDAGLTHVSLADTAGHAQPMQVEELYQRLFALGPGIEAACHFHDTYGLGMANVLAALRVGVKVFESSFAGLGGCPFTKVAAGNVATEDLVHTFQRLGRRPDVKLDALIALARDVAAFFGRPLPGRVYQIGPVPTAAARPAVVRGAA